jgi:hypothetical protein
MDTLLRGTTLRFKHLFNGGYFSLKRRTVSFLVDHVGLKSLENFFDGMEKL